MNKRIICVAVALAFALQPAMARQADKLGEQIKPGATQATVAAMASGFLARNHYKPVALDNAMSERVFDRYLKALDYERMYFTQADIDRFSVSRDKLDDAIKKENLQMPFTIYGVYMQRLYERMNFSRELLKTKFDFSQDESFQLDREKAAWPKTEDEARDLWRKRVKNDWLRLKLAGKEDKAIRETLDKRYDGVQTRIKKVTSDDVFSTFMNAYTTSIEPHTNYMEPRAADNFDIQMRLSLEGIGAVLQTRDEYTIIREIVAGSPAGLSGKLKVGDRIVAIAQGEGGAMQEILGWRIDDVVQLVRGPKDSMVRLEVLPADAASDAKHAVVNLIRKKITMEDQVAKKSVLEVKDAGGKRRVGVITLASFYQDFDARRRGDKDFRSATGDVARLLGELKKDKVDSVLIDLRDNGGGSLNEAVELTGLFIDKGPVVQQRLADGRIYVESDVKPGVSWDGPVGVLINRGSASASEIFAAAIQDYGRGLIIGESSFGKGTVQNVINLDRQFQANEKARYGELKMTVAQFFRVNGGTTQLRGVTPDIKLPVVNDPELFGESSYENALPWTSIKAAYFQPAGDLKEFFQPLQHRHEARIAKDKDFKALAEDLAEVKRIRKENWISLNETVRRKERDAQEVRSKAREARLAAHNPLTDDVVLVQDPKVAAAEKAERTKALKGQARTDDGLQAGERSLAAELAAEKAAKNAKDIFLNEAAHVLADEVNMLKTDTRLAARTMPYMGKPSN